jgi:hypothetical protein
MKQIIEDVTFEKGFHLYHTDGLTTRNPVKFLNYGGIEQGTPNWKIAQWGSRFNLANGTEWIYDDYSYEYRDESKYFRSYKGQGRIELGLDASKEYQHPRRENENWPHILLEQEFAENYYCFQQDRMIQTVDFEITKYVNRMDDTERNMLHTVQFQWFLAIQNRNLQSTGYGDFFWFGLPFYDYPRYNFPPAFQAKDGGKEENTGKFINIIDSREILDKPVILGERYNIKVDSLGRIKEAFYTAKENNFLQNCCWEDMCISNMNIGFEITGTFDVSVMINKIQVML